MATSTYSVTGMTCDHCVKAVTDELMALDKVSDVSIDLETGSVTVTSADPLDRADVASAVDEAGYALA